MVEGELDNVPLLWREIAVVEQASDPQECLLGGSLDRHARLGRTVIQLLLAIPANQENVS